MHSLRLCCFAVACLPGCATVVDGTTQPITLRTAPNGAACTVRRGGEYLGTVAPTPGTLLVGRSRRDLTVVCSRPGWEPTVANIEAKFTAVTWGNLIVGGWVGVIVDAATGANFRYDTSNIIQMTPLFPGRAPTGISSIPMSPSPVPAPTGTTVPRDATRPGFIVSQANQAGGS